LRSILPIDTTLLPVRRGKVEKESYNTLLGIDEDGKKEIFTLWMSTLNGESSLLWQEVLEVLRERELRQVLLIAGDGLTGLREVAKKVYPKADFQSCVLHKVRASLNKVRRKDREKTSGDLKRIYQVNSKEEALLGLKALKETGKRFIQSLHEAGEGTFHLKYLFGLSRGNKIKEKNQDHRGLLLCKSHRKDPLPYLHGAK